MKKKVDVRGVPARKASRSRASGVAVRSVAKKRPSPPARSRAHARADMHPIRPSRINCPMCKGAGDIPAPKMRGPGSRVADNAVMAKLLRKEGYSLREIQRFLGYKSCRSAQLLIDRPTPR